MNSPGQIVPRPKLTYSVPEAAKMLGVSPPTMYQLVKSQGFPTVMVRGRLLVSVKGLERWVDEQAQLGYGR